MIAFDPSSTALGWAADATDGGDVRFGVYRPPERRTAIERIDLVVERADELVREHRADQAVVEVTTGKVNPRRHGGRGAGLAVYGGAVFAVRQLLRDRLGRANVYDVLENEWTRGRSKASRIAVVAATTPDYDAAGDKGGDAADALLLREWWLTEQRLRELQRGAER